MSRVIVVTGTDTGVGKTVVTAALGGLAAGGGQRVAIVKPIQTGLGPAEAGDIDEIRRLSGIEDVHEFARFAEPLAPGTAARRAGVPGPSIAEIASAVEELLDRDLVLVEGAGGLLVHLDVHGGTVVDLAAILHASVVVVTRAGLGTLNSTALTCQFLRSRGLPCVGLVVGSWPAIPDLAATCNLEDLPSYTAERLLGRMPEGAAQMTRKKFLTTAAKGLDAAIEQLTAQSQAESVAPGPGFDVVGTLDELHKKGLYRRLRTVGRSDNGPSLIDGREALLLCSNDYLGLRTHPTVCEAAAAAADRWGAGAGSSRLVAGNLELHRELERAVKDFKGHEACVLFGSGYLANTGVISALAGRGHVILSDALNHASIIDGCRQSGAQTIIYEHSNLDALADGLQRAEGRATLIVTDAVFSMDGDLAPLDGIVELARRHRARVLVNEAHATGVVGPGGRGLVAELGLENDIDIVIGTLSKALGSYGAFACCNQQLAELLINRARTLIFSTALPPPSAAAALAAVRILREQPELVERLQGNARALRQELAAAGFDVADGSMPIVPLIVGSAENALGLSQAALDAGVYAQAIRPPTVPDGTSRLRLTVAATHTEKDLRAAAVTLAAAHEHSASRGAARPPAGFVEPLPNQS